MRFHPKALAVAVGFFALLGLALKHVALAIAGLLTLEFLLYFRLFGGHRDAR
jgi:hypothetical protein